MTQTFFPFDGQSVGEDQWRKMARLWLGSGVMAGNLNKLLVSADSDGMNVDVATGRAFIRGHFFESDAIENLPIDTADPSNPRIDRVVVSADFVLNTIALAIIKGTAAGSPTAPSLTQTEDVLWQIPLAQVLVGTGVSTITSGNVTDERKLLNANSAEVAAILSADQVLNNDTFTDLNELYWEAEANEKWIVEYVFFTSGATGAGLKFKMVLPSGATCLLASQAYNTSPSGTSDIKMAGQDGTSVYTAGTLGASPRQDPLIVRGPVLMGSTMGRIKLSVAQNVDTGATTIDAGSYMRATRVV